MKIVSIGSGAVGGTVAARLVRAGIGLAVVDTDAEHVSRLRDPGLRVNDDVVRLDASTDAPDEADVVLLSVRAAQTTGALASVPVGAQVVSLQNGIQEDTIAQRIGAERTIGCVVGFGATWIEPGHVDLTATGDLVLGRLDGSTDPVLDAVAEVLGNAFPTRVTGNIRGALWGKMLVNSMTVLGAVGGVLTGEVLATRERRSLVAAVVAEGVAVAEAEGVRLPKVFGMVDPALADTPDWEPAMQEALLVVAEGFGDVKSVTLRDIELGRPTEIDAVTGEIVRRGEADGVPTPLSARVYERLKGAEAGTLQPGVTSLDVLAAV